MSFPERFAVFFIPLGLCSLPVATSLQVLSAESSEGGKSTENDFDSSVGSQFEVIARVTGDVWFGSEPVGPESFRELRRLGIKYVVSVDGAKPNVKAAEENGLRYVHIPFGYDGVPELSALSLARVMREAGGKPVFIHCHHGKHRGPVGAAIACRVADANFSSTDALDLIRSAGTSPEYQGLWRDVEDFKPPSDSVALPELVEVAEIDSLTEAMASMGRAFDHLKLLEKSRWQVPASHPDLIAVNEAVLVWEALRESRRLDAGEFPEKYLAWMRESEEMAYELTEALRSREREEANRHFQALKRSCKQCHREYRD